MPPLEQDPDKDCNIYARELGKLKNGLPLWFPEPTKFGEVLIGDIGYIREGAFYRLYNVLRESSDPINQQFPAPSGFERLKVNERFEHKQDGVFLAGPLYSKTVQSLNVEASADA